MVNLVLYEFTKPLLSLTIAAMIIPIQLPLIVSKKLMYKKFSSIANVDVERGLILKESHAQVMAFIFILYFYIYSIIADKMLIEFSKKLLNYIIRTLVRVC
jgi:hypothetical protein